MIWKLLPIVALSGCSIFGNSPAAPQVDPVEDVRVMERSPVYHPPMPNRITSLPVEWTVLTPDTMQEYLDDLNDGNAPSNAFYGLTSKGYENLSGNMAEVKRYIRQALSIIEYYRKLDEEDSDEQSDRDAEAP